MKWISRIYRTNNFLSLAGNAAGSILGFVSFALLVRLLTKSEFGNWIIFLTLITLFELLRTGLLQTGIIKFVSGADTYYSRRVLGTGWLFALLTTATFAVGTWLVFQFAKPLLTSPGAWLFFRWYWLLTLVSLPFNFASWYLQAMMDFRKLLYMRLVMLFSFIALLLMAFFQHLGLNDIVGFYIFSQGLCSLICLFAGWTKLQTIRFASKSCLKELFHFGKFSMGTMMGANLLRNSDTLLIGAFLNAEAVAIYSVPLKLFEFVEIPLRSFVATALPTLAALLNKGDKKAFSLFFEKTTGTFTILLLPVVLGCLFFAEPFVRLLGGEGYIASANILRIFALFAVFMPLDRYSGIALDVLNKPGLNFYKVALMLLINIVGDILVIRLTGELWAVAAVSIATFFTGTVLGCYFLRKALSFSVKSLLRQGISESRRYAGKLFNLIKPAALH